jgi:DNA replication protein DnaC
MIHELTRQQLHQLRMPGFAKAWQLQQQSPQLHSLGFDERMTLLVEAEIQNRENNRLKKLLQLAKLHQSQACLEDIQYAPGRGLEQPLLRQLASCSFVTEKLNILITGMTGTGKTYIACAIAQMALRQGIRCLFKKAATLADEFSIARAEGSTRALLSKLSTVPLLVIDDFGLTAVTELERKCLLDIFDERYAKRPTIITSQLPVAQWHQQLGDPTLADAICDRIIHASYRIALTGPSMRKERVLHS